MDETVFIAHVHLCSVPYASPAIRIGDVPTGGAFWFSRGLRLFTSIRIDSSVSMAQSSVPDAHRPAVHENTERVYVINCNSPPRQGRCNLDDGSAVLCAFEAVGAAIEATADDPSLRLVRHRSLSPDEQDRVEEALLV